MSKRTFREMSLAEVGDYAAEELEEIGGRLYQNGLCTKGRYQDLLDVAAVLKEKIAKR